MRSVEQGTQTGDKVTPHLRAIRIIKVGRTTEIIESNPIPTMPTEHVPECHISMAL